MARNQNKNRSEEDAVTRASRQKSKQKRRPTILNGIDPSNWIKLVWKIVNRYSCRDENERLELFQAGAIFMLRAAQIWDPDAKRTAKFITYAWKCIVCGIRHWRESERKFRRPVAGRGDRRRIASLHLFSECGPDFVTGRNRVFAVETPEVDELPEVLQDALRRISHRERGVITARMYDGLTLEETAKKFGVSKERIRQIEMHAVRHLRDRCGTLSTAADRTHGEG